MTDNETPLSYRESVMALSGLDFETDTLREGELGENVTNPIDIVAAIFKKDPVEVLKDLLWQREQEIEEVKANDKLQYGNLDEYGEVKTLPPTE